MDGVVTVVGLLTYAFSAVVSGVAALVLLLAFLRDRRRLLFWGALCFSLLALDSSETLLDYVTPPWFDLSVPRTLTMLAAGGVMLFGSIWET
jgi:hypothetical protein